MNTTTAKTWPRSVTPRLFGTTRDPRFREVIHEVGNRVKVTLNLTRDQDKTINRTVAATRREKT